MNQLQVKENADGELFFNIPDDVLERLGWEEGDGIEFEDQGEIELDAYIDMVKKKTGALLGASLCLPAIMHGESSEKVEKLYNVGKCLGVAFQLQDDILEIFGDEKVIGKSCIQINRRGRESDLNQYFLGRFPG